MRESPRIRRLRSDFRAMQQLKAESSIIDFLVPSAMHGGSPEAYLVRFHGSGLWRPKDSTDVLAREIHEVSINLGAAYPRMMPDLQWKTPIFHPNISASGVVCLGGYSTHWVPSLRLDELCEMLWDMIRYANYDVESPYNREAALWTKEQEYYRFPVDDRPLRNRITNGSAGEVANSLKAGASSTTPETGKNPPAHDSPFRSSAHFHDDYLPIPLEDDSSSAIRPRLQQESAAAEIVFVEGETGSTDREEIVDAEVVDSDQSDSSVPEILFIE